MIFAAARSSSSALPMGPRTTTRTPKSPVTSNSISSDGAAATARVSRLVVGVLLDPLQRALELLQGLLAALAVAHVAPALS
jgi:hypothetical protein